MLENKVSLLLTFSDFSGLLWSKAHLSDLHLVRAITARHLIDLAASARHACTLAFSRPDRVEQLQSSSHGMRNKNHN